MIRLVATEDLERVRAFLEAHVETSLFLLSNLAIFGPRLMDHWNSGNYRLIEEAGRVVAVFCLTRRGTLLAQAAGRAELAEQIMEACESESIEIAGIAGEWPTAVALWELLRADPRFEPGLAGLGEVAGETREGAEFEIKLWNIGCPARRRRADDESERRQCCGKLHTSAKHYFSPHVCNFESSSPFLRGAS